MLKYLKQAFGAVILLIVVVIGWQYVAPRIAPAPSDDPEFDRKAGYKWARAEKVDDPDDCTGRSPAFIQGCMEYAADQQHAIIEPVGE